MKRTTRNRLIEYIGTKKGVSASELARILRISAADARHHLGCLEDEGVVVVVGSLSHGRGRPTQLYRLSREINRHNLTGLTCAVMKVGMANIKDSEREEALRKTASCLTSRYNLPGGSLTQRLTYTIRCLNEMNYLARWEAHRDAPRILITHCPYASVVSEHPEICQMDAFVIKNVLGQPVARVVVTGKHEAKFAEEEQCIFRLNPEEKAIDSPTITK